MRYALLALCIAACRAPELEASRATIDWGGNRAYADLKPRLVVDGQEIASPPSDDDKLSFVLELPRGVSITSKKLSVRLDTTCGPREEPLSLDVLYGTDGMPRKVYVEQELEIRKAGAPFKVLARASLDGAMQGTLLYIDNRGGAARTLTIGSKSIPIDADFVGVKGASFTACEGTVPVRIDGEGADVWPKFGYKRTLVDAVGGRCYERREISYAREGSGKEGSVTATPYVGHRIYELNGEPDFFLKPAPTVVQGVGPTQGRLQIAEVPCGKKLP